MADLVSQWEEVSQWQIWCPGGRKFPNGRSCVPMGGSFPMADVVFQWEEVGWSMHVAWLTKLSSQIRCWTSQQTTSRVCRASSQ